MNPDLKPKPSNNIDEEEKHRHKVEEPQSEETENEEPERNDDWKSKLFNQAEDYLNKVFNLCNETKNNEKADIGNVPVIALYLYNMIESKIKAQKIAEFWSRIEKEAVKIYSEVNNIKISIEEQGNSTMEALNKILPMLKESFNL